MSKVTNKPEKKVLQRRKCIFNEELKKKYPFIMNVPNQTPSDVRCTVCGSEFSVANSGRTDIDKHIEKNIHVKALKATSGCQPIQFTKPIDVAALANEGVWSYHVVKSNQSFRSTDCASKIFRECFDMKGFHCARTKAEAIVNNVFYPLAEKMLKEELLNCRYVTLTTDASNHGNTKMMPVIVRYFSPTVGVRVKMIEFSTEKNETSETIAELLIKTADKNDIANKFVAFCGDNCPTNFGSAARGGQNNVFYRLKLKFPSLIGIGCAGHIGHNAMKFSCDQLPFDIQCIVAKIFSHFKIHTVRIEALKSICDLFEDIEFAQVLGYANTRFLALAPAVGRLAELFDPLKTYFLELHKCPKVLEDFFKSPIAKLLLLFIKDQVYIQ